MWRSAHVVQTRIAVDTGWAGVVSLHITITSSPRPAVDPERRRVSVHHDLQLLKAGLLYADRVTLCSMPAAMMAACFQAEASSAQDRARFLEEVARTLPADKGGPLLQAAAMLREFSRPRKGRYRSQQEILRERWFCRQIDQLWPQAIADANALLEGSGADGLRDALSTGVVDLHAFSSIENAVPELATIGEVVQVRRELARPLVGFRGAVLAFSTQIEAAVWDGNFAKEADATFVQKVAPAMQRSKTRFNRTRS